MAERDARKLDKLIRKASSVLGRRLDPLKAVVETTTTHWWSRAGAIADNERLCGQELTITGGHSSHRPSGC